MNDAGVGLLGDQGRQMTADAIAEKYRVSLDRRRRIGAAPQIGRA